MYDIIKLWYKSNFKGCDKKIIFIEKWNDAFYKEFINFYINRGDRVILEGIFGLIWECLEFRLNYIIT